MLCPEMWAFELLIILSGYVGVSEQAVMVVSFNLTGVCWSFPLGSSEAAAAVVGNSMGENDPALAKKYLRLTTLITIPACLALIATMFFGREWVAGLYFEADSAEYSLLTSVMCVTAVE